MAGGFIEVDTQLLQRDENSLNEKLGVVRKSLERVYGQMEELDAMWDGPANEAFRQQFAQDREQFEAICKEVQELINSVGHACKEYNRCEAQVKAAVSAISI